MKIQSISNVITNSSSELFIFDDGRSKEEILSELDKIYPNWRDEYFEPFYAKEAPDNIDNYINQQCPYAYFIQKADILRISRRFYNKWSRHHKKGAYYNRPEVKRDFLYYPSRIGWKIHDYKPELSYGAEFAEKLGTTPDKLFTNWDRYNPVADRNDSNYDIEVKINDELLKELVKQQLLENESLILMNGKDENPDQGWIYKDALIDLANKWYGKI